MLARALLLATAALLFAAPAALANSSFTVSAGVATIEAQAGGADSLRIGKPPAGTSFILDGSRFASVSAAGCTASGALPAAGVTCPAGSITRAVIRFGDGADTVRLEPGTGLAIALEVDLGAGTDSARVPGTSGRAELHGGSGDDTLEGGAGSDLLDGGTEDDDLFVSPGADELSGGAGFDSLQTDAGKPAIAASLDDVADDGGSGANARADIEDVLGGELADQITGSAASNLIDGGGGNDRLDGAGGFDALDGGDGDDVLLARDGLSELVGCGEGTDTAEVDDVDIVSDCETVSASADARPDADGDGVRKPADCNDASAAIRPGAPELLDDDVDQDCDGADAVDLDRDRDRFPRPGDCDDTRADVHPGAAEAPGNQIDEDCDGKAAPFPRLLAAVVLSTISNRKETRVVKFAVTDLVGGERIGVRCDGHGCPYHARSVKASKRGQLSLLAPFETARLKPKTVVTVRIARADGVVNQFTARVRAGRPVKRSLGCIVPPRRTPKSC